MGQDPRRRTRKSVVQATIKGKRDTGREDERQEKTVQEDHKFTTRRVAGEVGPERGEPSTRDRGIPKLGRVSVYAIRRGSRRCLRSIVLSSRKRDLWVSSILDRGEKEDERATNFICFLPVFIISIINTNATTL